MSKVNDVFVSASHQERALVKKLIEELKANGISAGSSAAIVQPGASWQKEIEDAVTSAAAVVVLVDPKHVPDRYQQFEWSTALEAQWQDPKKHLVPVLLEDAELPSFLSGKQALQLRDPKQNWRQVIEELIHVLKGEETTSSEFVSTEEEDPSKRRDRLKYIEEVAQTLKAG